MLEVVCTIAVMMSGGHRDYPSLHGIVVKDAGSDYMLVDFTQEFKKRHINTDMTVNVMDGSPVRYREYVQTPVQRVHSNDCLYVNPPKEWTR